MTALSELLNDAKGDQSVDTLIAAAEARGRSIPQTFRATAYKALAGDHAKQPREETLTLFAEVFRLDVRRVREAVGRTPGELGPWTPVAEASQLSQDQRQALNQLIKTIVRGGEADGNSASNTQAGPQGDAPSAGRHLKAARRPGRPPGNRSDD